MTRVRKPVNWIDTDPRHRPGAGGRPTTRIAGIEVEILDTDRLHDGTEWTTSVMLPVPGTSQWAIVQHGHGDGTQWRIGYGGWLYDMYPSIETAVTAICTFATRDALLARNEQANVMFRAERHARELREAFTATATPPGAITQP